MGKVHDKINERMCSIPSMRELREEFAILTDFAKAFQHSNMMMMLRHDCGRCHSNLTQIETVEQNFNVAMENIDIDSMKKCAVDMTRQTKSESCLESEIIDLFLLYGNSFDKVDNDTAEEIMEAIFVAARGNADPAHELVLKLSTNGDI